MDLVRRGSLVLSTAPTNIPHPWKVEWARGEKFRCFLGRIYDPEVMATDEWEPERFPEGLSQGMIVTKHTIQRKYLKKDRTAMNSKAYATSIKSGSVKVYTKASFGRVTYATSVLIDEEKGCAEWDESVILAQSAASVYFVLHKTTNRWMVSAVLEADVTENDIKLAVVKKRESASVKDWRLIPLWKSDLYLPFAPAPSSYHFQIHAAPNASPTPTACRLKVEYDDIFDNNMLMTSMPNWASDSDGTSLGQNNPNTGHDKATVYYTPVIATVPLSMDLATTPYIDTAVSGYLYLHFYRNHSITQGTPYPEGGFVTDEITAVEVVFDASSTLQSNSTISEYWSKIGSVTIDPVTFAATNITMDFNFLRTRGMDGVGPSIVRTQYAGNFYPTSWIWNGSAYVVDQPATVVGNSQFTSAYGYLGYPSLI